MPDPTHITHRQILDAFPAARRFDESMEGVKRALATTPDEIEALTERAGRCRATDVYFETSLVCDRPFDHHGRHTDQSGWTWGDPSLGKPRVDLNTWANTPTSLEGNHRE